MINRLLNFSTHPGEPEIFNNDWRKAEAFLKHWGFDGFELYPVGDYPCEIIPPHIISGIHLRFFIILTPLWKGDKKRLLQIFGNWQTVENYYGGRDAQCITDCYTKQLNLASHLGCSYAVFHPVHCEFEYVYNWKFPWHVNDTLDICAEVINAACAASDYNGQILFENLWWPGSFRLDSAREYDYLLSRIDYPNCGIALDTGHLLNKNPGLTGEREAADYLLDCIDSLGSIASRIKTVHLTKSLSGPYILQTQSLSNPYYGANDFWERMDRACRHIGMIDRHKPFELPYVSEIFEKINPSNVVFEFTFTNKIQWEQKIQIQKQALMSCLWPEDQAVIGKITGQHFTGFTPVISD